MKKLSTERLETQFADFKPRLNAVEATEEANRCINCFDAPCIKACPTGIDIPKFIRRIGAGHVEGAAKTILDSNVFGLSCAECCPVELLCEGGCVYNKLNHKPITIGKLQRFAIEHAYDHGIEFYKAGKPSGRKVALVGAGAASFAAAHELRLHGHETTIFEKSELAGGLNTNGIAPYKMRADTSLREIERIMNLGVQVKYGMELGRNLTVDELLTSHDAVFLGLGLGPDSRLDVAGVDKNPRVLGAVDFIARMKLAPKAELAWLKDVHVALVVGGGNTALDACRELRGLGVKHVVVSYRRGEEDMSGYKHEFKWARQEGVDFWFGTLPTAFEATGNTQKVTLTRTKVDAQGKVALGTEKMTLDTQLVLVATGQAKLESLLSKTPGLKFEKGKLVVDAKTGRTGNAKIFAGGDLANGGMEVVNAVAEGKRAARAIHEGFTHG
ncbi:MAG: FAD-dependent oxidoreductase [Deltaproteobacteria bacterium]|nr:FAD-dependent oxidoreductase [Deltaproteobacteria bacterium]